MSQIDDNQIQDRLKHLSQVEPGQEATDRAIQKARDAIGRGGPMCLPRVTTRDYSYGLPHILAKLAAAAVLMIGAGFIGGRLSAPEPMNVQQLQAVLESSLKSSLEPVLRQEILAEIDNRLQLALATDRDTLKQELALQVRGDLEVFAEQALTAAGNYTDRRLMGFARMLEAARIRERQHVAAGFDYMGSRFVDGLVTLAAQTDNLLDAERTTSVPDVSEN